MSISDIRVWVVYRADRNQFTLRWNDPTTQRRCQKTTDAKDRKKAERLAGQLEKELVDNGGKIAGSSPERPTWDQFCTRYKENYLVSTSPTNQAKWRKGAESIDDEFAARRITVPMLADITAEFLEAVESRMRAAGNAASTVKSKMDTIRSGLGWAAGLGLMQPIITPRERGRVEQVESEMRGRPLTVEELERLQMQAAKHEKTKSHADTWSHFLKGLWLSGLRISEAMDLHESRHDCHRPIGLDSKRPAIAFLSSQKNRRDQVVAITPDFAEFLRTTKPIDGYYFNPIGQKGRYRVVGSVGRIISEYGSMAKIVTVPGATPADVSFATAHDLRRTFAQRWASRVMPPILQHLMRHSSIETTMKFYVGSSADAASLAILDAWKRGSVVNVDLEQVATELAKSKRSL